MRHIGGNDLLLSCAVDAGLAVLRANAAAARAVEREGLEGCAVEALVPGAAAVLADRIARLSRGEVLPGAGFTLGERHFQATFHAPGPDDHPDAALVIHALDVTRHVRLERMLRASRRRLMAMARRDHLTGLLNRRGLDAVLATELRRARRSGKPLALAVIDIDWFKGYNDHFGHPQGDRALQQVATALTDCLRRGGDAACRHGGEEFVLVLPETGAAGASRVAENCRRAVEALGLAHPASPAGRVTVSIGIARTDRTEACDAPATQARALLARADDALYAAKHAGRNCVATADFD